MSAEKKDPESLQDIIARERASAEEMARLKATAEAEAAQEKIQKATDLARVKELLSICSKQRRPSDETDAALAEFGKLCEKNPNYINTQTDHIGDTMLSILSVSIGRVGVLDHFLSKYRPKIDIDRKDNNGNTMLYCATGNQGIPDIIDTVRVLLKHGANPNISGNSPSSTPLISAATSGQIDKIMLLLEHKADPNYNLERYNQTPLGQAAQYGHIKAAEILLNAGAKIDGQTTRHPLTIAMSSNQMEMFDFLVERGARLSPKEQEKLLVHMMRLGDKQKAMRLVELGADTNITYTTNRDGNPSVMHNAKFITTPLLEAIDTGDKEFAAFLLEHGANPDATQKVREYGQLGAPESALACARRKGDHETAALLIEKGAGKEAARQAEIARAESELKDQYDGYVGQIIENITAQTVSGKGKERAGRDMDTGHAAQLRQLLQEQLVNNRHQLNSENLVEEVVSTIAPLYKYKSSFGTAKGKVVIKDECQEGLSATIASIAERRMSTAQSAAPSAPALEHKEEPAGLYPRLPASGRTQPSAPAADREPGEISDEESDMTHTTPSAPPANPVRSPQQQEEPSITEDQPGLLDQLPSVPRGDIVASSAQQKTKKKKAVVLS